MQKTAIIGTTNWGLTLGLLVARKGREVRFWTRTKREASQIRKNGVDKNRFPGVTLPENAMVSGDMAEIMDDVSEVILAVPSAAMRQNILQVSPHLSRNTLIISASKGLEIGSNKRMSEIIAEEIDERYHNNICVLSGPQLAREIMQDLPAASVIAADDLSTARKAQRLLTTPNFCVFTNSDGIFT